MKLEEAIAKAKILNDSLKELTDEYEGQGSFIAAGMAVSFKLVLDTILTALRPVSREQVEKMRGEWNYSHTTEIDHFTVVKCSKCGHEAFAMRRSHDGRGRGDGDGEIGGAERCRGLMRMP